MNDPTVIVDNYVFVFLPCSCDQTYLYTRHVILYNHASSSSSRGDAEVMQERSPCREHPLTNLSGVTCTRLWGSGWLLEQYTRPAARPFDMMGFATEEARRKGLVVD
jgi:hypothetical protein